MQRQERERKSAGGAWCCAAFLLLGLLFAAEAAAPEVTAADLQAALRSLGFLTSLHNRPSISIAVVYPAGDGEARIAAARAAALLGRLSGPGSASLQVTVVPASELSGFSQHVDALYLMPLPYDSGRVVSDFVRKQNVVSISADPACLDMGACVLMVQSRSSMTIVLDTVLAQAAGAKFSTVFTMMVKRR